MSEQEKQLQDRKNRIGIFVNPRQLRGLLTNKCSEGLICLIQAAKNLKIDPVWFSSDQPWLKSNMIKGSSLEDDKEWCTKKFPLPEVVYDRGTFHRRNRYKAKNVRKILSAKGVSFVNKKSYFSKWETFKLLKNYPDIKQLLPETIILNKTFDLEAMLTAYGKVCVKTNHGSMGKEVIFINKLGNDFEVIYPRKAPERLSSFQELTASLSKFWLNKKCIIQRVIPLASWNNRLFDLRILMQKIDLSTWDCTAISARIAPPDQLVTNISQGGTAANAYSILSDVWPLKADRLIKEIKDLGYRICKILEENYGTLGEIGLDVALDKEGNLWVIEVGGKPAKSSVRRLNDENLITQAYERPLLYAKMLLDELDNNAKQEQDISPKKVCCNSIKTSKKDDSCNCCCEKEKNITFEVCQDIKEVTLQDIKLKCEGRFLKVRVELDKVCPGRKVTVGVLLCEKIKGTLLLKGFRACEVEIPESAGNCVQNQSVGEFCFILPEEDLCCKRKVSVKILAHYSSFPGFPSVHA